MSVALEPGDCLDVLLEMAAAGTVFDAVVTDPPYDLVSVVKRFGGANAAPAQHGKDGLFARQSRGFMGKAWDGTGVAFRPDTWRLVHDVMRPGAHLLAFGGSRTYHRMACAIEDAGFEVRDCIMWLYGTGFPKSHDVSKGIDARLGADRPIVGEWNRPGRGKRSEEQKYGLTADSGVITAPATPEAAAWAGWGTALKPAFEPIIVARKPLDGTVATNVLTHGCGGLNIDACRIPAAPGDYEHPGSETLGVAARNSMNAALAGNLKRNQAPPADGGRWPANVIHDGSDEVLEAFAAYGERTSGKPGVHRKGRNDGATFGAESRAPGTPMRGIGDSGSAARFFKSCEYGAQDCTSYPANCAASDIPLSSEHAVSVLSNAVAASMPGSAMLNGSYRAPSMSVTANGLGEICRFVIETIQSFVAAYSHGPQPERRILSNSRVSCAAQPGPNGTMTIMISLLKSGGCAGDVTFAATLPNTGPGVQGSSAPSRFIYSAKASAADRANSKHPTVKPLALMRYLVTLVTPPGGTVLDPFSGSGTTLQAAAECGFNAVGIERDPEYQADILRRIAALELRELCA